MRPAEGIELGLVCLVHLSAGLFGFRDLEGFRVGGVWCIVPGISSGACCDSVMDVVVVLSRLMME